MLLPQGFSLMRLGVHIHVSALSASFVAFWLFPREGEQADRWESLRLDAS